jgi:hypothetical protein
LQAQGLDETEFGFFQVIMRQYGGKIGTYIRIA